MEFVRKSSSASKSTLSPALPKRGQLEPVHSDIQEVYDPEKTRVTDRNGRGATFTFDSEATATASIEGSVTSRHKTRSHAMIIVSTILVCALFLIGLLVLPSYL